MRIIFNFITQLKQRKIKLKIKKKTNAKIQNANDQVMFEMKHCVAELQ